MGEFEVAVCSVVRVSVAPAGERLPVRPLLRREYDALVDAGLLEGAHVELLDGMMVEMSPQGGGHARAVRRLNELLMRQVQPPWAVSVQSSFAAGERSQPEPDAAVVRESGEALPSVAALAVEVAVSSHHVDLRVKPAVYAAAGVAAYVVVDLPAGVLRVHTGPTDAEYDEVRVLRAGQPLRRTDPDLVLDLADLLPPPAAEQ